MANLPAELVDDILLRLAVKPLLRFRCVSKRWLALIDSPDFIKLHLNRSIATKNNRTVMVREFSRTYSVNVDSPEGIPVEIHHPLKNSHKMRQREKNWFKGSCNGLILISYHGGKHDYDDTNFIWNPSTRNYHKLPFAEFDSHVIVGDDAIDAVVYGIGYDSVHDDYKVVRMILFYRYIDETYANEVKVYSLKSMTWRRIQDFPYDLCIFSHHGVLTGGALHWLVCESDQSDDPYIAAFDLATEEYRLLSTPPNISKFCKDGEKLEVLEECLCIYNRKRDRIDVWVMKCYGVSESWTKLISVDLLPQHQAYWYYDSKIPLVFSKDGTKVLFMQSQSILIWFDIERNIENIIDVRGVFEIFEAEFVIQSLVPLATGSKT